MVSRFPKLTETFVLFEALALRDAGVEVHIYPLVPHTEEVQHPEVAALEPRVHRVPMLSWAVIQATLHWTLGSPVRFGRSLKSLWQGSGGSLGHFLRGVATYPRILWIARHVKAAGFDHVHAHFANHPALAARIVHDLTGTPFSFTAHGSDLHKDPRGLRTKVAASAFTVAISEFNKRFILEHCGADLADRIKVLFCGADVERLGQLTRDRAPAHAALRIACVAALREVKGHTHLFGALKRLQSAGVDFECQLAGAGPLQSRLQAEVEALGLSSKVTFLGPQTREQIFALLQNSDVVALTSIQDSAGRREGIPVSLMEGMAAGLPVVSTRLSGIPELVEHGVSGFLTEQGDEEALTQAFQSLAADQSLRLRMGAAGRERVLESFDLTQNARALAEHMQGRLSSTKG